jgi:hypothetical protein
MLNNSPARGKPSTESLPSWWKACLPFQPLAQQFTGSNSRSRERRIFGSSEEACHAFARRNLNKLNLQAREFVAAKLSLANIRPHFAVGVVHAAHLKHDFSSRINGLAKLDNLLAQVLVGLALRN